MDDSLKNKILKDFFDSIICHLDESRKNFKQVKTETSFKKIEKNFNLEEISSPKQLKVLIKKYLSGSVKTGNSNFYNQLFSGFSLYGFMGEVVSSATNTSMYTFEMSPVATVMEKQLTKKMSDLIGETTINFSENIKLSNNFLLDQNLEVFNKKTVLFNFINRFKKI